ncbi:unnamed protein product [Ilex paraguariensis]|uniref:TPX2 central domain-containing protein n=1 Tax=Ilex paraguariensis TaxID=185542 RepID=A0ABC8TUF5_9AQUA
MDEEMDDMVEYTFTAIEIDLDYEFDAVRYFDFSREESLAEAREAELWFQTARSYPPSPFVTNLVPREDILLENVNTSPKTKDVENTTLPSSDPALESDSYAVPIRDVNIRDCEGITAGIFTSLQSGSLQKFQNRPQQLPTGLTFYKHMVKDNTKAKIESFVKPYSQRTSTLMKPTASQLAKQNRPRHVGDSRLQKLDENNNKSSDNPCGIECQAAKRQKIEGGHLRKVADTKQQTNLVHKVPKRDGTIEGNSVHAKLRLTIPREPDLETAHRAQRMRPKTSGEVEHVTSTIRKFKALPLNRKILEAPSFLLPKRTVPRLPEFQEFHLKTSERAAQHSSAVSSFFVNQNLNDKILQKPSANSIAECGNGEFRRANFMDAPKLDGCEKNQNFKARPLNKKIFSSKGDIGVLRNVKRETTEFNLQTEKRVQQDPPVELFNKLSLASELHPNAGSELKLPRPTCITVKRTDWVPLNKNVR